MKIQQCILPLISKVGIWNMPFDIPLDNHMIGFPYFDLKEESQTQMENRKTERHDAGSYFSTYKPLYEMSNV
jgi:hypothetical protein